MRSLGLASLALIVACSGAEKDPGTTTLRDTGVVLGDDGFPIDTGAPTDGGFTVGDVGNPEVMTGGCVGSDPDCDGDGYKQSADCNDKDGTINADAYDFEGDGVDNDCDGTIDNPVKNCDSTPTADNKHFARAADLCPQRSKSAKYGGIYDPVYEVKFGSITGGFSTSTTRATNTQVIPQFGENKPRNGASLFGMQSGPLLGEKPRESKAQDGFPVSNGCGAIPLNADDCKSLTNGAIFGMSNIADYQEVRMSIRVPSNAKAMSFDFQFFSSEFNEYWNTQWNDAFFVLVTSKKVKSQNVAKDSKGLALTVNSGFFQLCPKAPGPAGVLKPAALKNCVGVDGDPTASILGTLKGTFFDGAGIGSTDDTVTNPDGKKYIYGGGSGWLTTKFEVEPGESMVVRFIVHDTADAVLDSAAIVDNIRWDKAAPKVPTGEIERPPM